ncbi:MAG: hypothetical protein KDC53_16460 [Saprospiraceae bacterium]|nr:hypothetical protein [Saprospiraceae bacterium]
MILRYSVLLVISLSFSSPLLYAQTLFVAKNQNKFGTAFEWLNTNTNTSLVICPSFTYRGILTARACVGYQNGKQNNLEGTTSSIGLELMLRRAQKAKQLGISLESIFTRMIYLESGTKYTPSKNYWSKAKVYTLLGNADRWNFYPIASLGIYRRNVGLTQASSSVMPGLGLGLSKSNIFLSLNLDFVQKSTRNVLSIGFFL